MQNLLGATTFVFNGVKRKIDLFYEYIFILYPPPPNPNRPEIMAHIFEKMDITEGVTLGQHFLTISQELQQNYKGQDQTYSGEGVDQATGQKFFYIMVTDGHGKNDVIEILRSISTKTLSVILGNEKPVETLANYINMFSRSVGTGATMCLVKMYDDRIECINSGDSRAAVFKNGELVHFTTPHTCENEAEKIRLKTMNPYIVFTDVTTIAVINEKQIVGKHINYATWPDGQLLACTQALGHGKRTGYAPDRVIIPLEKGCTYQVSVGSDGVWDMVIPDDPTDIARFATMTAKEAVDFVMGRWLQSWEMAPANDPLNFREATYKREDCDDVGIVVARLTPM